MRISIGSDHRGVDVKRQIIDLLRQLNHEVTDVGTQSEESVEFLSVVRELEWLLWQINSPAFALHPAMMT